MASDAHVLPIDFLITGGEIQEAKAAPEFSAPLPSADYTLADKGYDSEELCQIIRGKS